MATGALVVVPTPLGHPDDLSPRAVSELLACDGVAAEDTRVTEQMLRRIGAWPKRMVSCHEHNERGRVAGMLERIQQGATWALVSDAGTPGVSDPGFVLVRAAVEAGVPVRVLPGPCAAIVALVGSGLPTDRFHVLGFLPRDAAGRREAWQRVVDDTSTLVAYEAPHRIVDALGDAADVLGDRDAALAFELTKTYERWHRAPLRAIRAHLAEDPDRVRGECTLVVAGSLDGGVEGRRLRARRAAEVLARGGVAPGLVRDVLAEAFGVSRREIYQVALAVRSEALSDDAAGSGDGRDRERP